MHWTDRYYLNWPRSSSLREHAPDDQGIAAFNAKINAMPGADGVDHMLVYAKRRR